MDMGIQLLKRGVSSPDVDQCPESTACLVVSSSRAVRMVQ